MSETRIEHQTRLKDEAYGREKALNIEVGLLTAEVERLKLTSEIFSTENDMRKDEIKQLKGKVARGYKMPTETGGQNDL